MSATATSAPSRASAIAHAEPMPPPAPVTMASFPATRPALMAASQCGVEAAIDGQVLPRDVTHVVAAQRDDRAPDVLARRTHAPEREHRDELLANRGVLLEEDLGRLRER